MKDEIYKVNHWWNTTLNLLELNEHESAQKALDTLSKSIQNLRTAIDTAKQNGDKHE